LKVDLPSGENDTPHEKQGTKSEHEHDAPSSRVDDEHDDHGDKRMTRQE
jgi:hypothetical protein